MSPLTRRLFLGNVSTLAALTLAPRLSWGAEPPPVGRKLGVALVGLGGYSRGQLGPALRQTQYCQLAGVVTGDHAKGLKWAQDYGFPAANIYNYSTMAQLANNPAIDIRPSEVRGIRSDDEITRQGSISAQPGCRAIDSGNHWLGHGMQ